MKQTIDSELSLVSYIRERFKKRPESLAQRQKLLVGIGDDGAVFDAGGRQVVVTTDAMAEGVHFDHSYCTPYQVGFKLVTVNVSDVFAMNANPAYLLLSLTLPKGLEAGYFTGFMDGVMDAINMYGVELIGGDITSSVSEVTVSATLIGFTDAPIKRDGASVGDLLYVTGHLGDSACALRLLRQRSRPVCLEKGQRLSLPLSWPVMEPLLWKHLMPRPHRPEVASVGASAMMDVSDGLSIDLRRLCAESGTGARVYESKLPLSKEMVEACVYLKEDPLEFCLCGGEDYEYLFTTPVVVDGAFCIGEIIPEGIVIQDASGTDRELKECGYEHFKD